MLGMTGSSSSGLIQTLTLLNTICTEVLVVGWRRRFDTWPRSKVQHSKTSLLWYRRADFFVFRVMWSKRYTFFSYLTPTHPSQSRDFFCFFFFCFFPLWPCWVFTAVWISLAAVSRGYLPLPCTGFSLRWLLLLQSSGPRCKGFRSCSTWA